MTTFGRTEAQPVLLLVHGAWLGAWSWEKVRCELAARGWEVQTVDLPSVADRGAPRLSLHDDAALIRARIAAIGRPVVVVAHSYGGAVVSQGAAGLANVSHLVYICAFQLDVGESVLQLSGHLPWWNVDGDTMTTHDTQEILFTDVAQDEAAQAIARMKPFTYAALTEELTAAAWRTVPSTYVICDRDRAVADQETIAARATYQRRLPTGHMPLLSMPLALTDLIIEAANF